MARIRMRDSTCIAAPPHYAEAHPEIGEGEYPVDTALLRDDTCSAQRLRACRFSTLRSRGLHDRSAQGFASHPIMNSLLRIVGTEGSPDGFTLLK